MSHADQQGEGFRVLEPAEVAGDPRDEFAMHVLEGLSDRPKRLSSRFLYDDRGSEYFRQITELPEYYPTRCEAEILQTHGAAILDRFAGRPINVVDLGAGDGAKTMHLLRYLSREAVDFRYVPIDISAGAMRGLCRSVRRSLPEVALAGLVSDYWTALRWLAGDSKDRCNLVLFLGSNIGNFTRATARSFLRRLWSALAREDRVFLGFDLKKDIELLLRAYNDAQGVTARFNMNLLLRINRDLGGHFDESRFRHYATYDVFSGAVECYLVSQERQTVAIDAIQSEFAFDAWEPIHTEYCYKYLVSDVTDLARSTGFTIEDSFFDANRWFMDTVWRAAKDAD